MEGAAIFLLGMFAGLMFHAMFSENIHEWLIEKGHMKREMCNNCMRFLADMNPQQKEFFRRVYFDK